MKKKITCPICNRIMMPMRCEYPDKSGWAFGWSCSCTKELRGSLKFEIFVFSNIEKGLEIKYDKEKYGEVIKDLNKEGDEKCIEQV